MESEGENCPYCGTRMHTVKTAIHWSRMNRTIGERLEAAVLNALRSDLKVAEVKDSQSRNDQKIQRQAKRIKQLENLLHEHGVLPYANRKPWEV